MKNINMNQIGIRAAMFESYLHSSKADVFYTSNNSEVAV